jgi:hypothetical protein
MVFKALMVSASFGSYAPNSITLPTTFSQLIAVAIVVNIGNQPNTHAPSNGIKLRPAIGINPVSYAKSQTDPA